MQDANPTGCPGYSTSRAMAGSWDVAEHLAGDSGTGSSVTVAMARLDRWLRASTAPDPAGRKEHS